MTDNLRDLIERWRDHADGCCGCADDLESALSDCVVIPREEVWIVANALREVARHPYVGGKRWGDVEFVKEALSTLSKHLGNSDE